MVIGGAQAAARRPKEWIWTGGTSDECGRGRNYWLGVAGWGCFERRWKVAGDRVEEGAIDCGTSVTFEERRMVRELTENN